MHKVCCHSPRKPRHHTHSRRGMVPSIMQAFRHAADAKWLPLPSKGHETPPQARELSLALALLKTGGSEIRNPHWDTKGNHYRPSQRFRIDFENTALNSIFMAFQHPSIPAFRIRHRCRLLRAGHRFQARRRSAHLHPPDQHVSG